MKYITKKILTLFILVLLSVIFIGCQTDETTVTNTSFTTNSVNTTNLIDTTNTNSEITQTTLIDPSTTTRLTTQEQLLSFAYNISLPSTELLDKAEELSVVEGAPDLMIIGMVLDSYYFYHYETMSGFEYVKVFNNTTESYNMKDHRIVLANPMQGQNYENEDARIGNKSMAIGHLFNGLIDEDFVIPPLSTGLIWLQPYYWTCGSGTGAYNKIFSASVIHKDTDKTGAINQTLEDFKGFWDLENSDIPVYKLTNMGIVSKRPESGTDNFFPIYSPGSGTPYTHLNSKLLRSLEIQKFDDQGGTATIDLLNKYSELSSEKQSNPDLVYGKIAFNVMEILDDGVVQEVYSDFENCWKYFKPVVKANFSGLIDTSTMSPGQTEVNFLSTSSPGVGEWPNTVELQFRPPLIGERVMQLQLPLREYSKLETYMLPSQFSVMRFVSENVINYRFVEKSILLTVDPDVVYEINWRSDEIWSFGRLSNASPTEIHVINLTRPAN
ncbi:hypothetical protein RJI07_03880 [Mycoplasmatota bacterium WC30]